MMCDNCHPVSGAGKMVEQANTLTRKDSKEAVEATTDSVLAEFADLLYRVANEITPEHCRSSKGEQAGPLPKT